MIKQAWIAVGLAALLVGCGGAGGGSGLGSKTGSTGGSTAGSGVTGGSVTGGSSSGTTGGSLGTTGGTTGSSTNSTGGSTGSSTTGSTTGSSTGSTGGGVGSGTTGGSTTSGSTTGSDTTTGGSLGGSSTGSTGGNTDIIVSDDPGTTGGDSGSTTGGDVGTTGGGSDSSTGGSSGPTGTTGGSTGSTTGGDTGGPVGDWKNSKGVLVKVYEVDLTGPAGNTVVFSDPAGVMVDIKKLRDNQGPRFLFLGRKSIPAGSYNGATVVVDSLFTDMAAGQSKGVTKQFSPSLSDGAGHSVLEYSFGKTVNVGAGSSTVVVNFDLEEWQDKNNVVTPHLRQGKAVGLNDPTRQEHAKITGQVSNLIYGQNFSLKHDSHSVYLVTFGPSTQVVGGGTKNTKTLANGHHVMVDGFWDPSKGSFSAASVKIQSDN